MKDEDKTKEQLTEELNGLRERVAESETVETEYKQSGEAELESEEMHRMLFSTSPNGIVMTTMDGKIIDANQAYQDMLGYTLEELKNKAFHQLTPEKWYKAEAEAIKAILEGGGHGTFEKEYIRKDGTTFPVSLTGWVLKDKQGVPQRICAFVEDNTEHKKAEQELRESEENLKRAQQLAHLGSWYWDINKEEDHWSDEKYRIFGMDTPKEKAEYGSFLSDLIHD